VDTQSDLTDPKSDLKAPAATDAEQCQVGLARLFERARLGDQTVLPALREALDANPEFWDQYGDLSLQVEASVGVLAAGQNLLLAESFKRKLQAMKKVLSEGRSAVEALVAGRVVVTWAQVHHYDALAAQSLVGSARLRELQKLQDAAHRRHLAALKTLAVVRKLMTPAPSPVQVATRLGRPGAGALGGREGIAGRVPVRN
jgi:hypothetical protein